MLSQVRAATRGVRVALMVGLTTALACAHAQPVPPYPVRPVTTVVPYASGTAVDKVARIVAGRLAERMGQPFNVENRPSDDLVQAAVDVLKAPADGYTLLFATSVTLGIGPALTATAPFRAGTDFVPMSLVSTFDYLLVASPKFGAKDLPGLLQLAKAQPGKLRYASPGKADPARLLLRAFATRAGVQLREVPFRSVADAQAGVLAGKADVMFLDTTLALPLIAQGKLRTFGTAAGRPVPVQPDILPLARALPGFDWRLWMGIVARTGTPVSVVSAISVEMREMEATAGFRDAMAQLSMETIPAQKPEHFGAIILSNGAAWRDLVKAAGVASP